MKTAAGTDVPAGTTTPPSPARASRTTPSSDEAAPDDHVASQRASSSPIRLRAAHKGQVAMAAHEGEVIV